jgi:ketosteroid isomerase-like protein
MTANRDLARQMFEAYEARDRAFVEQLLAPDFTFTSPYDDRIDRDAYFERCWPNSGSIGKFHFIAFAESGDSVFVLYRCDTMSGSSFRNTECLTFAGGKLKSVEVFFGDPPAGIAKADYPAFVDVARQAWEQRLHSM